MDYPMAAMNILYRSVNPPPLSAIYIHLIPHPMFAFFYYECIPLIFLPE